MIWDHTHVITAALSKRDKRRILKSQSLKKQTKKKQLEALQLAHAQLRINLFLNKDISLIMRRETLKRFNLLIVGKEMKAIRLLGAVMKPQGPSLSHDSIEQRHRFISLLRHQPAVDLISFVGI